jgi:hypothetical protein
VITTTVDSRDLAIRFEAPWTTSDYAMFLASKRLPEVVVEYSNNGSWPPSESYTLRAPARFAHLIGLARKSEDKAPIQIEPWLFDYQRWIVEMALEARRFAIWSDCGTGKTPMQLEWSRHVMARTGGAVLIFAPLQVCHQTPEEARKFWPSNPEMHPRWLETREDMERFCRGEIEGCRLGITNFHKLLEGPSNEIRRLSGVVLDESSMLKSGGGTLKWNMIKSCKGIEYKLSCTATPAPNDVMEYASQASFLEKLRNEGEILWTYFVRDQKTTQWTVKPHARKAFYEFMASWSIYLRKPGAYGFHDPFHDVPEPEIVEVKVDPTPEQSNAAHEFARSYDPDSLIPQKRLGVRERSKLSQVAKGFMYRTGDEPVRVPSNKPQVVCQEIARAMADGKQCLVWTVFDEESEILRETLPFIVGHNGAMEEVATIDGRMPEGERAEIIDRFRHGEVRVLISKAQLLGYGLNFQFCTRMVFSGFDDSFERFYQAVRRAYRYGSTERLRVVIPYVPGLEDHVWENVLRKKSQWESDIEAQERAFMEAHGRIAK